MMVMRTLITVQFGGHTVASASCESQEHAVIKANTILV